MSELVGLQGQPPDMMGKLSQLLQIRGQRAQVQQEEQTARQRAAIAKYDWNRHIGQDGTIDVESVAQDPELQGIAGDSYLDLMTHVAQAKQQQLTAKSTLVNLRTEQRKQLSDMMGALRSDPDVAEDNDVGRQKVNQAFVDFQKIYGTDDTLPVLEAYGPNLQKAPKGRMSDALKAIQLQAFDVENQVTAQKPEYTSTGAKLKNINPNVAPGTAPDIDISIPPGFSMFVDPRTGNPYLYNSQTGEVRDFGNGAPGGVNPRTPIQPRPPGGGGKPPSLPSPYYPGQAEDIATNQKEVAGVRAAADQAPTQRSIFRNILKLSDDTSTGPLVSYLQNTKIGGQVFGDNYQELGKYLEKNAIASMQAMGAPGSDARLEAASAANGSTKFNPKALRAVTQFNFAANSGLEQYRAGMDKAVGLESPDYTQLSKFKSDWAKNFDIDVFRIENAEREGDQKALAELREEILRTPGRAKELKARRAALDSLATTGKLQ